MDMSFARLRLLICALAAATFMLFIQVLAADAQLRHPAPLEFPTAGNLRFRYHEPIKDYGPHAGVDVWTGDANTPAPGNAIYLPAPGKFKGYSKSSRNAIYGIRFELMIDSAYSSLLPVTNGVEFRVYHMANEASPYESYVNPNLEPEKSYPKGYFLGYQGNHEAGIPYESTITHAHIEIWYSGASQDPTPYFGFALNYNSSPLAERFVFNPPLQPAASQVRWHPDSTLVQVPDDPAVYLIHDGKRKHVTDPDLVKYRRYGLGWEDIVKIPAAELACYPQGEDITTGPRLLRGSTADVYYIFNNRYKRLITSPTVFNGIGLVWDDVQQTTDNEISSFADDPVAPQLWAPMPDGRLMKSPDSDTVYVITNGKRQGISTADALMSLGFVFGRVVEEQPATVNGILALTNSIDDTSIGLCGGAGAVNAAMTSPTPGSTFSSTSTTFIWNTGTGVSQYWLYVGTTIGGKEIFTENTGTSLSSTVTGLPTNGSPVYVRLWSLINSIWGWNDYTYTACNGCGGGLVKAAITSPTPGSTLSSASATFTWNTGTGVSQYWLYVGTTFGGKEIFTENMGTSLSSTVPGLPTNGSTVYVRLWSLIDSIWGWNDYTYTSCNGCGSEPGAATLLSPSGTITTATPTFVWNAVSNSTWYQLWVNDSTGNRIKTWYTASQANCASGTGTCSATPSTVLASGGAQWWVQTWNDFGYGPWSDALSFTLDGGPPPAATLLSPSGTISNTRPTYIWNAVSNSTWYYLWVNDSEGEKIQTWYTASQANCASGTGTCSVTPSTALATGAAQWWVQTWNDSGHGPWSSALAFVVPTPTITLNVLALADIALAGQPDGILLHSYCSRDSSPINSPAVVPSSVTYGQMVQISATGLVDVNGNQPQTPPNGNLNSIRDTARAFGISSISGPSGALVGVFLGPDTPDAGAIQADLDFSGAAQDLAVLRPLLQQAFYVGTGQTSTGTVKSFVVPQGAMRLFLGVLDSGSCNSDNAGSFSVTVSLTTGQAPQLFPNISSVADIALAGQPEGILLHSYCSRDSSTLNSPVLVPSAVTPGQVVQVSATGLVDPNGDQPQTPPNGNLNSIRDTARAFGISSISGPSGALVGVFLGPDAPNAGSTPANLDFSGAARDLAVLRPLLQQPFYIGSGKTGSGTVKSFVVPEDATRLFLGVLDSGSCNSDNTGSFTVTVSLTIGPPNPSFPNISSVADIALAGQEEGVLLQSYCSRDNSPLNSPVAVPFAVTPGQVLQISAAGLVDVNGNQPQTPPNGNLNSIRDTARAFGISSISGPAGALVGVFLGPDTPDAGATPPDLDFSGAAVDVAVLRPLLQQSFYIGSGKTGSGTVKSFVAPEGATRLFLGVLDSGSCNSDNTGSFTVTVNLTLGPPPQLFPNVSSIADIALADQADGVLLQSYCRRDSSPLNSPVLVPFAVAPGQVLQISATGLVDINGNQPQTPPYGNISSILNTARAFGISSVRGPAGALVGVFLGPDTPNAGATPPDLDFSGTNRDLINLRPLLQQAFYMGSGKTGSGTVKSFVVPEDATRLFLGVLDSGSCNSDNTGSFNVTVSRLP